MKSGKLAAQKAWLIFALWAGAESCWKVHCRFPNIRWPAGFTTPSKISR
jgi:hypothetical protein